MPMLRDGFRERVGLLACCGHDIVLIGLACDAAERIPLRNHLRIQAEDDIPRELGARDAYVGLPHTAALSRSNEQLGVEFVDE